MGVSRAPTGSAGGGHVTGGCEKVGAGGPAGGGGRGGGGRGAEIAQRDYPLGSKEEYPGA
jgi:hypothetical protein